MTNNLCNENDYYEIQQSQGEISGSHGGEYVRE
jgi:hypothetical protein